jgi:DNA gyrase/topoisomerase IV subunit A
MIKVEFKDEEVTDLIEMYLNKVKSKKDDIAILEKDVRELNAKILQLKRALQGEGSYSNISSDELYSEKWQWVKKIKFAIELQKKALTANEIYETLTDFESSFIHEKRKVLSSISGTLSSKSGTYAERKDFIRKESDSGEFEYVVWDENFKEQIKIYEMNIKAEDDLPF